jgi:hypothetical protein
MNTTHVGVSEGRFLAFRLAPGEELLSSLRRIVRTHHIRAGYVAGVVGSLSWAHLRFAGRPDGTLLDGCFEVVSLVGTLDAKGEHLHMTISNPEGATTGGHVLEGCVVRTTMELVLGELPGLEFRREYCERSTYEELAVLPRKSDKGEYE